MLINIERTILFVNFVNVKLGDMCSNAIPKEVKSQNIKIKALFFSEPKLTG